VGAKVLVVAGDPRFRASLRRMLARASLAPVEAADGRRALEHAANEPLAAVVLDVDLPDIHGYEVCRELRELHGERVAIILVSDNQVERHDRIAGLLLGADDYLVKPVDEAELLTQLRRALARANGHRRSSEAPIPSNGLTPRELEVLSLLVQGRAGREIASTLVISPKTVSSHLQHVMAKLGVHSRAQAVARAYEMGLIRTTEFEAHVFDADELVTPAV
jgi:DNA-binding NarL/FixJ family response regulator